VAYTLSPILAVTGSAEWSIPAVTVRMATTQWPYGWHPLAGMADDNPPSSDDFTPTARRSRGAGWALTLVQLSTTPCSCRYSA